MLFFIGRLLYFYFTFVAVSNVWRKQMGNRAVMDGWYSEWLEFRYIRWVEWSGLPLGWVFVACFH